MLSFAQARQVGIDDGGDGAFVAEVDLDLAQVLALFEQMGGVRMAERVDMGVLFDAAGLEGLAKAALESSARHRFGGGGSALAAAAFGGEEKARMAVGFPKLTQELQGALGQGDVAVAIALARADVQEHAARVNVADLQAQPLPQTQAAGVDGDKADPMVEQGNQAQDAAHLGGGEDYGQLELGVGAGQIQFVWPGAVEGFLPEELDGADGLGAGLAGDLLVGLEMDAVLAQVLGRKKIGGLAEELTELAQTGKIGLLGARTDGQELQVIGEGF
jgi:hypothetical protein